MAIADDFSINVSGDIRYTGTTGNYTVIEFHRWLGDLMDDAQASGNDILDITDATASERSTDNIIKLNPPYNIDDTAAQHLYDGSIIQGSGESVIYDGLVVISNQGTPLEIIQSGVKISPNFWTSGYNNDALQGYSHRFMVKVRDNGIDIDGRRIIAQTRGWGYTYSQFPINGTARGNNVAALTYATDLNNQTPFTGAGGVSGWTGIVNLSEGYTGLDADSNGTPEYYYSEWTLGGYEINDFYERMKYLTRAGSTENIYGLNGELFRGITHELDVVGATGTFNAVEPVSWSGGSGQILAINSRTAPTKVWIQLIVGVAPTNGQVLTGSSSSATTQVSGSPTDRTLSFPFCGQSTGSSIIGSYGFGITPDDLTANDRVFDLTNTQITPPNNVTFTVIGLEVGEDRVLVGPEFGGTLQVNQLTLNTTLSSGTETAVVVTTAIPSDTPSSGTIRVQLDSGIYRRVPYTSWSGSTFTIASTSFVADNATAPANVFISYIDKLAAVEDETFTVVFNTTRSLFIRVRDGAGTPIKTFETTATLSSAGGSATVIRTSDA